MPLLRPTGLPLFLGRSIHTTRPRNRDVLARYALPAGWPNGLARSDSQHGTQHEDSRKGRDDISGSRSSSNDGVGGEGGRQETFGSMATNPAIASIQDVPAPTASDPSSRLKSNSADQELKDELDIPALPVPAMTATTTTTGNADESTSDGRTGTRPLEGERTEPITVAGVFIPVKPKPPGEEGQFQFCFSILPVNRGYGGMRTTG
jgi:hypothetical protein